MHSHGTPTGTRLKISAALTFLFVAIEFGVGLWSNSLALISDAGHNLTDALALVLSAWAFAMATRPVDAQRSFGYHRVGVLAALGNALTLALLAVYIFWEGYQRLLHPEPVASTPMILVALIALVLNVAIALWLRAASKEDVNVRSAFVHMAGDAVSSIGVVIAGVGITFTGSTLWDPIVSLLIGLFILWSGWGIVTETVHILLEGTPAGLDVEAVARDIIAIPGVASVHDLHAWSLASNLPALSAHVVLAEPSTTAFADVAGLVAAIKQMLVSRYRITHATIETHCSDSGGSDDLHGTAHSVTARSEHDHDHDHTP